MRKIRVRALGVCNQIVGYAKTEREKVAFLFSLNSQVFLTVSHLWRLTLLRYAIRICFLTSSIHCLPYYLPSLLVYTLPRHLKIILEA